MTLTPPTRRRMALRKSAAATAGSDLMRTMEFMATSRLLFVLASAQQLSQDRPLQCGKIGGAALARVPDVDMDIVPDFPALDDQNTISERDGFRNVMRDQD